MITGFVFIRLSLIIMWVVFLVPNATVSLNTRKTTFRNYKFIWCCYIKQNILHGDGYATQLIYFILNHKSNSRLPILQFYKSHCRICRSKRIWIIGDNRNFPLKDEAHAWFTTVLFIITLSDQYCVKYCRFSRLKSCYSNNFLHFLSGNIWMTLYNTKEKKVEISWILDQTKLLKGTGVNRICHFIMENYLKLRWQWF